ncbi:uncharacterized protein LOC131995056 [Stomoxys calcitrans]|uniref:uncharacterized protein LOC131995056 n=1 Tax=Stomoxys calcitrans TaxID=35570 RepID=UPI0027E22C8E|nr:uncharacterized protein LOC131995056 [Stomoxys calcitrans]
MKSSRSCVTSDKVGDSNIENSIAAPNTDCNISIKKSIENCTTGSKEVEEEVSGSERIIGTESKHTIAASTVVSKTFNKANITIISDELLTDVSASNAEPVTT